MVMEKHLLQLLRYKKLSATKARLQVLSLFAKLNQPLSYADIHAYLDGEFDRVTLYRMLDTFVSNGLIRSVPALHKPITYVLLDGVEQLSVSNMFFLNCLHCNRKYILPALVLPNFELPLKFNVSHVDIVIEGKCPDCS
jgi:Fur family ferric uptake transcriptional regulator